jgi:hypothetical protein
MKREHFEYSNQRRAFRAMLLALFVFIWSQIAGFAQAVCYVPDTAFLGSGAAAHGHPTNSHTNHVHGADLAGSPAQQRADDCASVCVMHPQPAVTHQSHSDDTSQPSESQVCCVSQSDKAVVASPVASLTPTLQESLPLYTPVAAFQFAAPQFVVARTSFDDERRSWSSHLLSPLFGRAPPAVV